MATLKLKEVKDLHGASIKDKASPEWIKYMIDYYHGSVDDRSRGRLEKAYKMRNGRRDISQFEHITNKYGIESPTELTMIPIINRHINALKGKEDLLPLNFKVSCKDRKTIDLIKEERKNSIIKDTIQIHKEALKENLDSGAVKIKITKLLESYELDWLSSYEVAAQNIMNWVIQKFDFNSLKSTALEHILVSGEQYYQSKVEDQHTFINRILNPLGVTHSKPRNSMYVKDADVIRYKEFLPAVDVLARFHKHLNKEQIERLQTASSNASTNIRYYDEKQLESIALRLGYENVDQDIISKLIEVDYWEWKSPNVIGSKMRLDRYEGYRIDHDIYIGCASKYVNRSLNEPYKVDMSINGLSFNDVNGVPYSLVLETEELQNEFDIYRFHLRNLVAQSGNKSTIVPMENLPEWLGTTPQDRYIEAMRLSKQEGGMPVSLSQEGSKDFSNYGAMIDFSLDQSVGYIKDLLVFISDLSETVTGVSKQAQGQVANGDLKGTTEMAINLTNVVTQPIYTHHNLFMKNFLTDAINNSKHFIKPNNPLTYAIDSHEQKMFSVTKGQLSADFDVFIMDAQTQGKKVEKLEAFVNTMVGSGIIAFEDAIDLIDVTSITEAKHKARRLAKKKTNEILEQLKVDKEGAMKEIEKLQKQIEGLLQEDRSLKQKELSIKEKEAEDKNKISKEEIENKRSYDSQKLELEKKRVDLEQLQVEFNAKSMEVKNK